MQFKLGVAFEDGEGVEEDKVEAVKWYQLAAAQYNLGILYYYGKGTARNKQEAIKWFKKAANQGAVKAQETLKQLGY